jgi:hypothetical protein
MDSVGSVPSPGVWEGVWDVSKEAMLRVSDRSPGDDDPCSDSIAML